MLSHLPRIAWLFGLIATLVLPSAPALGSGAPPAAPWQIARIEGRVLSRSGRPIDNARVTIKNDGYSPLKWVFSDSAGRFQFTVREGAYYVEVEPLDKPFERKEQRLDLNPTPYSKLGEVFFVEIVLAPRDAAEPQPQPGASIVFFQEVPEAAEKEYRHGLRVLEKRPEEAYAAIRRALQIFPDYYAAMETLGSEYVKEGYFEHALPILVRAIQVNPNGLKSYYALGVLCYQTERYPYAVKAFARSVELDASDVNATIYHGLSLMRSGKESDAEAALKRAYALGAARVPEIQLALSSIYANQKRYREAAVELERLLRENPERKDRKKIEKLISSFESKAADRESAAGE